MAEQLCRGGYGTKLVSAAEEKAVRRGCQYAPLDPFSVQACPVYERRGYEGCGTLDESPHGHWRYVLRKRWTLREAETAEELSYVR